MTVLPIDFHDPLTEDDLDGLSPLAEAGIRFELDHGRLILMAPMKSWHADVSRRLCNVLVARGRLAYQEQGVRLSRSKVRFPDGVVFRVDPDPDASRHDPADIELVVEVISSDSNHEDRVVKPPIYAAAGIPEYWLADRHPTDRRDATVDFFKLGPGDNYERVGSASLTELEDPDRVSKTG